MVAIAGEPTTRKKDHRPSARDRATYLSTPSALSSPCPDLRGVSRNDVDGPGYSGRGRPGDDSEQCFNITGTVTGASSMSRPLEEGL
jgi:hypothetical protein